MMHLHLQVILLLAHRIPVAPVVVCVILVNAVLIHNVCVDDAALTVFFGVTVIVPLHSHYRNLLSMGCCS